MEPPSFLEEEERAGIFIQLPVFLLDLQRRGRRERNADSSEAVSEAGGKVLDFNVDKRFAEALDGLILVDLMHAEQKTLGRYMSDEGMKAFLAFHAASQDQGPITATGGS